MTTEELQQLRQVIREEIGQLANVQAADAVRITNLEGSAQTLLGISQNLVRLAQSHEERLDHYGSHLDRLDARLDRLADIVERFVTGQGSNGAGNGKAGK